MFLCDAVCYVYLLVLNRYYSRTDFFPVYIFVNGTRQDIVRL